MKLSYPAYFYKDEENGSYAVVVPDLPGCVSGGDTLAKFSHRNVSTTKCLKNF